MGADRGDVVREDYSHDGALEQGDTHGERRIKSVTMFLPPADMVNRVGSPREQRMASNPRMRLSHYCRLAVLSHRLATIPPGPVVL